METSSVNTGHAPRPDARPEPHSVAVVAASAAALSHDEPAAGASEFSPAIVSASIAVLVMFLAVWE